MSDYASANSPVEADAADVAVRLATAQLTGLNRAVGVTRDAAADAGLDDGAAGDRERRVVDTSPFTALVAPGGPAYLSYAIAGRPGIPVRDLGDSLGVLAEAFAPHPVQLDLIEQACPGAVELLVAAGAELERRAPVMTVNTATVAAPELPAGVEVIVARTAADRAAAVSVVSVAFDTQIDAPVDDAPEPADGGTVVAFVDGEPAAAATWLAVADGVSEIVAVATAERFRRRGLGTVVTAAAVRTAADRAGATLAWLTPGGDEADRVYQGVGFRAVATAAHLVYRAAA